MIRKIIRFRYHILFGAFALWMLFFDSNNLFYRISIAREVASLEKMKTFHLKALDDLRRQKQELSGNTASLEKFAREKYRMKRDNEDIFIVVETQPAED